MNPSQSISNNAEFMLDLQRCTVRFESKNILNQITWRLQRSHFHCIVGPNGAGKTTLLNLITGQMLPTEGAVLLHGQALGSYNARSLAANRAVVSQFHDTQFPFKCHEVLDMCLDAMLNDDFAEADKHRQFATSAMQISELMDRRFDQLSGGEQQRVMCARSLMQLGAANDSLRDKLLLLDEPSSNMDIRHQLSLFKLLSQLCRKGLTIIAIIHDLDLVYQFADQVIMLANGKAVSLGRPKDTLTREAILQIFDVNSSLVATEDGKQRLLMHI